MGVIKGGKKRIPERMRECENQYEDAWVRGFESFCRGWLIPRCKAISTRFAGGDGCRVRGARESGVDGAGGTG